MISIDDRALHSPTKNTIKIQKKLLKLIKKKCSFLAPRLPLFPLANDELWIEKNISKIHIYLYQDTHPIYLFVVFYHYH